MYSNSSKDICIIDASPYPLISKISTGHMFDSILRHVVLLFERRMLSHYIPRTYTYRHKLNLPLWRILLHLQPVFLEYCENVWRNEFWTLSRLASNIFSFSHIGTMNFLNDCLKRESKSYSSAVNHNFKVAKSISHFYWVHRVHCFQELSKLFSYQTSPENHCFFVKRMIYQVPFCFMKFFDPQLDLTFAF